MNEENKVDEYIKKYKDKYIDLRNIDEENFSFEEVLTAPAKIIRDGGLVLFPTETVYGLGANALIDDAVRHIFEAKGRKQDNPLILHISDENMLDDIAIDITELERKLMKEFWPGPLTIILNKKPNIANVATAGDDTVGVRMPQNKIARELIRLSGVPISAPSANISGRPSGTNIEDIIGELQDKVDYIINGGDSKIGVESTVIRVIDGKINILRPGKITKEDLLKVADKVEIDKHVYEKLNEGEKVLSPGMKYRHYAPNTKCILVYSDDREKLIEKMKEIAQEYSSPVIVSTTEKIKELESVPNVKIIDIGSENNYDEIMKNMFNTLRKIDKYKGEIAIIEGVKAEGVGLAIMNRLIRAAEHNYIRV